MANTQLQQVADSPFFKVFAPVASSVLSAIVLGTWSQVSGRLERIEARQEQSNVTQATTEVRLADVEKQAAAQKDRVDEIIVLKVRLEQLEHDMNSQTAARKR